jgi:uncharacterized membrane protein YidH (DUF202 family)
MRESESNNVSIFQVILSVLAAMIGVQSHESHKRDFENGNPIHYISIGILFVFIFVMALISLVNYILI